MDRCGGMSRGRDTPLWEDLLGLRYDRDIFLGSPSSDVIAGGHRERQSEQYCQLPPSWKAVVGSWHLVSVRSFCHFRGAR